MPLLNNVDLLRIVRTMLVTEPLLSLVEPVTTDLELSLEDSKVEEAEDTKDEVDSEEGSSPKDMVETSEEELLLLVRVDISSCKA